MDFSSLNPKNLNLDIEGLRVKAQQILLRVDFRSFLYGVAGIAGFYILLILYALLTASSTMEKLEGRLAAQTLAIERTAIAVAGTAKRGGPDIALPAAPEDGLHEKGEHGFLPVIREKDHMTPFSFYKRPFGYPKLDERPVIAIVLTEFGLSEEDSQSALQALPPEVSFVMSPYTAHAQSWVDAARASGHEVWLELPMENKNPGIADPGPAALLARSNLQSNQDSLHWVIGQAAGYAGLASFSDESFYRAEMMLENIFSEIFGRGLGFLELNPDSASQIANFALAASVPYVQTGLWIDRSFDSLVGTAGENGYALVAMQNTPGGVDRLVQWLNENDGNYLLVPASAYYDAPLYVAGNLKERKQDMPADVQIAPKPLKQDDHGEPENHH